MKKYYKVIILPLTVAVMGLGLTSCKKYLDAAPNSAIDPVEAFQNFRNFQGFTEELYNTIPIFTAGTSHNAWNFGEEELWENDNRMFPYMVDRGDYWGWQNAIFGSWFLNNPDLQSTDAGGSSKNKLYRQAWYGIRKANVGLANLDKLVDATQEEKNLIEGQLYFFRGWYHFMLMQYWGGLPYIDVVLPPDQPARLPRLNYQETADKVSADLRKAADLLPLDWDKIPAGKATEKNNDRRINKIMALGFLGKNLLWAGSPLMNESSTGVDTYDQGYCKQAADVFAEALALVESTNRYELVPFSNYTEVFTTYAQNSRIPGSATIANYRYIEAIFQESPNQFNRFRWNQINDYRPGTIKSTGIKVYPTANYINNYGMKNGYPLPADITKPDPVSGWDPTFPWKDRDPRFYHDIMFDGEKAVNNAGNVGNNPLRQYASLYTGGTYRTDGGAKAVLTGYMLAKYVSKQNNDWDGRADDNNVLVLSYLRLPDLYLMYAEAAAVGYGGYLGKSPGYSKTAVDAINFVRNRPGLSVGNVKPEFFGETAFLGEIRRERAVELSYEGHRFVDLRRWKLLDKYPYTIKTAIEFDRDMPNADVYAAPQNARVRNFRERELFRRNYTDRHYWFPFPLADVNIYEGFSQNPGW